MRPRDDRGWLWEEEFECGGGGDGGCVVVVWLDVWWFAIGGGDGAADWR